MKKDRRNKTRVQGSAKRRSPGLVNFVIALAYHFCLALPAVFPQPGDHLLAEPCNSYMRLPAFVSKHFRRIRLHLSDIMHAMHAHVVTMKAMLLESGHLHSLWCIRDGL